jgi:Transposase DDE domain group 1
MGAELQAFGAMALKSKRSPAEGEFLFEIDEEPSEECLTALGGVPLFVRTARSLDVPGSVQRNLAIKERDRGFDEATYVESFLVLNAVGGDCLDDFACLREDRGLVAMLGHEVPSPEAARKFLYEFHDPEKIEQAQRELPVGECSYVPPESAALRGLAQVNQDVVRELARRCAGERIATIDMDATVIESWKREAKATYEGGSGYQPMVALWAEMNLVVAEEFRDGNVPALKDPLRVAQQAYAVLPPTVKERYFRGDSACDEEELLSWLRDEKRPNGPEGFIGFAVSARMNPVLREEITSVAVEKWQPYGEDSDAVKECAQVDYFPEETAANRYREPLRTIAIRICKKQQGLFADGSEVKYFAVRTNLWDWKPKRLLEWHREKAGTIEAVHDVLKNELAGGVLPCGRYGANAAWFRLAVITYNVLTAMKRLVLPADLQTARPKRLRFLIFQQPGKLIHHARKTILRLARTWNRFSNWKHAMEVLALPAPA